MLLQLWQSRGDNGRRRKRPAPGNNLLVIDKARRFFHRRIEPQIFVSAFSVFMTSGDLDSHKDFVGVNLFDGAFLRSSINVDLIAGFQHVRFLQLTPR
jgi:hypothetical protein